MKMSLAQFIENRKRLERETQVHRALCLKCLQPPFGCYCAEIESFDPGIDFVILMHPMEAKRRIATGRMSFLCLKGAHLLVGKDFSTSSLVNRLIDEHRERAYVLYPGANSTNISDLSLGERSNLFPP